MPLPLTVLTVFRFSKIQTGFTFLALNHPSNPGHSPEGRKMDACMCGCAVLS